MWLLIVPVAMLVAVLMAVGLLAHGVFAIFGGGWPLLLIGLGIWMFVREDGRHRRARQWRPASGPIPMHEWRPPSPSTTPAASKSAPRKNGLPADLQLKVEQIRAKAEKLAAQADRFPPFSQDLYLARQTSSDYLPRTVETYLGLPRESVDRPMVPGGKTPHQELKAQLDLLDNKLDEIARELERQTHDKLLANRKFLQDRFELRNTSEGSSQPRAESA